MDTRPGSPQVGQSRSLPDGQDYTSEKRPRLSLEPKKVGHNKKSAKAIRRREKRMAEYPVACSPEDVLWKDIIAVLGKDVVDEAIAAGSDLDSPFQLQAEVELLVQGLSSQGLGIGTMPGASKAWAIIVPLALPGERIRARVYRSGRLHSLADLINIVTPNLELRDDSRAKCRYFGTCGGCQYQMLAYEKQLELKREVVVKAYANFSGLPESSIPVVSTTLPSPLQYEYRTKITPHFDAPPKTATRSAYDPLQKPDWLKIGFNQVGTMKTIDIEECSIATPLINSTYSVAREQVTKDIFTYKKGVSMIFRDSLDTGFELDNRSTLEPIDKLSDAFNKRICVTDHKAVVRETVGEWIFEYNGGSFFQNNNSVLESFTNYIRQAIFCEESSTADMPNKPTHLVDAYCGSGLFAISLSPFFKTVAGIELSSDSIRYAKRNARLNGLSPKKCSFRGGDAADIFTAVHDFPPEHTVLLIDPPRKGCDDAFINQLLKFRAQTVVYVSCNVHTQARDVGKIVRARRDDKNGKTYKLETLRGFDFFPQTAHVESVAVLRLQ